MSLTEGKKLRGWAIRARIITCSWCGDPVVPNGPRMRIIQSETIRCSGKWIAHFHPDCGDALLDYCEVRGMDGLRRSEQRR